VEYLRTLLELKDHSEFRAVITDEYFTCGGEVDEKKRNGKQSRGDIFLALYAQELLNDYDEDQSQVMQVDEADRATALTDYDDERSQEMQVDEAASTTARGTKRPHALVD
jgi:hypothetical protein